jgi:tRNA-binding protein
MKALTTFDDFQKIDIRVGTILTAVVFEKARKPAYQVTIDFGAEIGVKRSSAQITHFYQPEDLIGRQVVAVVNFPVRQIGNFFSEVLVLGSLDVEGRVTLLKPDFVVENGLHIG